MSDITRKYGDFRDLAFEIDLTAIGKVEADIEDIYCSIKEDWTSADDAIFLKQMTGGGITFSNGTALVKWAATEYDNFRVGATYDLGLFVKFTGDSHADENVDQIFQIEIKPDFLRA